MLTKKSREKKRKALQIRCEPFVGTLEPRGEKYDFEVRHTARRQALIWGSDFDLDTAVREVAKILLGLQRRAPA